MQPTHREDLSPWFLTLPDIDHDFGSALVWTEFFGNGQSVEIDVGAGRGLFVFTAASANPGINYLGIEIDFREGRRAARRLKKRKLHNARILGGDVNVAFSQYVRPHTVDAVHVYFPDPWWKKKHHRRRVFTDHFVDQCATVLKPGGLLHSWTDVPEYFEVISALMDHHDLFETLPPPAEREPEHDMDYQTSYERKKRKSGPAHLPRPVAASAGGSGR